MVIGKKIQGEKVSEKGNERGGRERVGEKGVTRDIGNKKEDSNTHLHCI